MKIINMFNKENRKRMSLKTVYDLLFSLFILVPILSVLIVLLFYLKQEFRKQSMQNIEQAQETIMAELMSDIDIMSMRMSNLVYVNGNEILQYAVGSNTIDSNIRYEYMQKLMKAEKLLFEPVKNIISIYFYMKNENHIYLKNESQKQDEEIFKEQWYEKALENPNKVYVGVYDTESMNEYFKGGKKDMMILVFALAPDITTDRSGEIEMVVFYQASNVADRIKRYNQEYLAGKNKLGIVKIISEDGTELFSTEEEEVLSESKGYTKIRKKVELHEDIWYIESTIKTSVLTESYLESALVVFVIATTILLLVSYCSRYFIRNIIRPIEGMNTGLKQVENGNLEVHIEPEGEYEIRNMIHQFNAMVRRLKSLIREYEEEKQGVETSPSEYLQKIIRKEISIEELNEKSKGFFNEPYMLIGVSVESYLMKSVELSKTKELIKRFERNPRYLVRSISYIENAQFFIIFYRIIESEYLAKLDIMMQKMVEEAKTEFDLKIFMCTGKKCIKYMEFEGEIEEIRKNMCLGHLGRNIIILDIEKERLNAKKILELLPEYKRLSEALYVSDEKNMIQEKEKLFERISQNKEDTEYIHILAMVVMIGKRFNEGNASFWEIFGQEINYMKKLEKIGENKSIKMWLTNYFAWIMNYTASKLNINETNVIVKAKHYMAVNYENTELSLSKVAEYVGLNEKYLTNRFTKEAGETFSEYLTGIRMLKARELLKTTNFKIYEIAEMVGYNNVEHFTRMFKKIHEVTPLQYRKNKKTHIISRK
jgi:AraC-type DNA-binding domain-containing proteins